MFEEIWSVQVQKLRLLETMSAWVRFLNILSLI